MSVPRRGLVRLASDLWHLYISFLERIRAWDTLSWEHERRNFSISFEDTIHWASVPFLSLELFSFARVISAFSTPRWNRLHESRPSVVDASDVQKFSRFGGSAPVRSACVGHLSDMADTGTDPLSSTRTSNRSLRSCWRVRLEASIVAWA